MKEPLQILKEAESQVEQYKEWQDTAPSANTFIDYAQSMAKAVEILQYAAIFYPKFIKVEGFVVVADHYTEDNWRLWREKLDARDTAEMVNHTHLSDFLYGDFAGVEKLDESVGDVLAFFWKMAVDKQFPDDGVCVEYDGDVINIYQPE